MLLMALLIVLAPASLRGISGRAPRVEPHSVEPLRIHINSAPWYHWTLLEGIGDSRARAIVEFRRAHGPFRSVDELALVPRLPAGWLERVRGSLVCENP